MGKEVKGYANRLRRRRGRSVGASLEVGKGSAKLGDGRTTAAASGIVQAWERRKSMHLGWKPVNYHMGAGETPTGMRVVEADLRAYSF